MTYKNNKCTSDKRMTKELTDLLDVLRCQPTHKPARDRWIELGKPWMEHETHPEFEGEGFSFYNVGITINDGEPRVLHNIHWNSDGSTITEDRTTQDGFADIFEAYNKDKKVQEYGADAAELFRSLVALNELERLGLQEKLPERTFSYADPFQFFSTLLHKTLYFTRINYASGDVVHNYRRPDQYIRKIKPIDKRNELQATDKEAIIKVLLDADSIQQVELISREVLDLPASPCLWTRSRTHPYLDESVILLNASHGNYLEIIAGVGTRHERYSGGTVISQRKTTVQ